MNPVDGTELLTEARTAELLALTNPKTLAVWRCTKRYALPYVKFGRTIRYRRKDVEAFIEAHSVQMHGVASK